MTAYTTKKIISCLCLFVLFANMALGNKKNKNEGMILLMGPTRAGKSCFINTITNKDFAKVGDDSGESTTKSNELYVSSIDGFPGKNFYYLIDTMGLDDSEESEFADHIIFANTTLYLRNLMRDENRNLDAILIFESLTNDSNQLDKTIKKLTAVFSDKVKKQSLVILNKNPKPHPKRIGRLVQIAEKQKMKHLHWMSGCGAGSLHDSFYDQMNSLHETILKLESIKLTEMDELIETLITEGRIVHNIKGENAIKRMRKYFFLGGVGLFALSALNVPGYIMYNLAVMSTDEIMNYFISNENYLITLAIEERIQKKLGGKKQDL